MIMQKCLQTYYTIAIALENFLRHLKSSVVIREIVPFCIILNDFGSKSGLKGYETKKSPHPYVFANKNGVRCRVNMLFVSAGTYDHEEVFTNFLHHYHCSKVFLRCTKLSEISQETLLFRII